MTHLLEGAGWHVRMFGAPPKAGVFGTDLHGSDKACRLVAFQALAGVSDAIAAVMMCPDDPELKDAIAALESEA